ncbi:MAG: hypothetical protein ACK4UN_11165 [Limisphaerales bacterium]
MKILIAITMIIGCAFMGWKLYEVWGSSQPKAAPKVHQAVVINGTQLPGMHPNLEATLAASQKRGAAGLRDFLKQYGNTIQDPRLAWIQLDYAVLLMRQDPAEAKKLYARVKKRTPPTSPVYPRIKQLEATYE